MKDPWTRMSADDAAQVIEHNAMVAFSGFTPAGSPKALPAAIAAAPANCIRRNNRFRFGY